MLSQFYYPIICTKKYVKTINFYEDHFDFISEFELNGFTILKHKYNDDIYLAILDQTHESIPEQYRKTASGIIINFPVKNVRTAYQQYYWEGLNILNEPEIAPCGRRHFFIEDPNGILIDVAENVDLTKVDPVKEKHDNQTMMSNVA